jgi:hypothetical protein
MDEWMEGFVGRMTLNGRMTPSDARAVALRLYSRIYFLSGHDAAQLLLKAEVVHAVDTVDLLHWER